MDWFCSPIAIEDDAELIGRLRRRDPEAAGELYERYGRLLYALILNIVGEPELAEELLAEALLKASNLIHTVDSNRFAVGSWLLVLARNHALNFRDDTQSAAETDARNRRHLETPALFLSGARTEGSFLGSESARRAFLNLPGRDRVILELAWFEAMTFEQIALRVDVPAPEVIASAEASLSRIRNS